MARINIEDSLWKDNRFQNLMIKAGSRHAAKGMILELFVEAQKFWLSSGGKGIPKPAWDKADLPTMLIECGLAEDRGEFIYAVGSEDQFAWLTQRSDAGKNGGQAAAKTRLENKGKSKRRKSTEADGATSEDNGFKPPSPSPSLTPSLISVSSSFSEDYSVGERAPALPADVKNPVAYFIGAYVNAYKAKYGNDARPDLSGPAQGRLKSYVKGTPLSRACAMIQTYCSMNDPWFLTKGHDFETFMQNLTKVGLKLDTGRALTRAEVSSVDHKQAVLNAFGPLIAEAEARETKEATR